MTIRTALPWAGPLALSAVALLGLGALGGCSADEHEGHAQGQAPADSNAPATTGELKSIQPSASYPLKTCVVSGDPLDGMGGPVAFEYDGTEIQFCCGGCIKTFKKDPARYMEMVRSAKR